MEFGDKRTDFAHQPFVWRMHSQSESCGGDQGALSPLLEDNRLCRETRMLRGTK